MPGGKRSTRLPSPSQDQDSPERMTSSHNNAEKSPTLSSIMKSSHQQQQSPGRQNHYSSKNDPLDAIQRLSLEEVHISSTSRREDSRGKQDKSAGNRRKVKPGHSAQDISPGFSGNQGSQGQSGSIVHSQGADSDIIRSGHQELDTLYASNDCQWRGPLTVNLVNAPNNSTVQCGCENINCPFCNLLLSIEQMDPSVLQ